MAGSPISYAVNFINCRVSTIIAYWDADGNVVRKLHQKVSFRISYLYVVNHQGEQDGQGQFLEARLY